MHSEEQITSAVSRFLGIPVKTRVYSDKIIVFVGHALSQKQSEAIQKMFKTPVNFVYAAGCEFYNLAKKVIAIGSAKGGVGKSTVTAYLARHLSGQKVGVIDADIYNPTMHKLLEISETPLARNRKITPPEKENIALMSLGFWVNSESSILWSSAIATKLLEQIIYETDWSDRDIILIDLPSGTGDIHQYIFKTLEVSQTLSVCTDDNISQIGMTRFIKLANTFGVSKNHIIHNMTKQTDGIAVPFDENIKTHNHSMQKTKEVFDEIARLCCE